MANVLGSLVIDVLANTGTFVSGMSKASAEARRAGRDIRESFAGVGEFAEKALAPLGELGEKIAGMFGQIGQAAGQAITSFHGLGSGVSAVAGVAAGAAAGTVALGGALFGAAMHAAELGKQIFEAHEKTGMAAENLSGLMAIAKVTGSNFEDLTSSLARAGVNLTKTAEHAGRLNPELYQLMGGAKGAAELGLKPMDDRIQKILASIFKLSDEGQQHVALQELLGKGWMNNVTTLRALAEQGYGPAIAKAKDMGVYFDDEHAKQAAEFSAKMNELTGDLSGLAVAIGQKVIPMFTTLIDTILNAGKAARGLAADTKVIGDAAVGNIRAVRADLVKDKLAWDDYRKGLADTKTEIEKLIAASIASGKSTENNVVIPTHHHADALERAAEASKDFWEKYNAGLKTASDRLPTFISYSDQITKALHPGQVQMPSGEWRTLPHPATQAEALGTHIPAMPGGVDQIGLTAQSFQSGLAGLDEFNRKANEIMKNILPLPPFKKNLDEVEAKTKEFAAKVSDQFAQMAVTGQAHWRQLFQGMEEEIISSGINRIFNNLIDTAFGTGASTAPGGGTTASAGGVAGMLGKIFGGGLQHGGDVTPGKAYIVGERHPEFFVPEVPGRVTTTLSTAPDQRPMINNFHFHGVQDFDSFKRSSSQMMALMQNQLASAYSRSR